MTDLIHLRHAAREIFETALRHVDAGAAVQRAVRRNGDLVTVVNTSIDLASYGDGVFAIASGKAAYPMATALTDALGDKLIAGVISGPASGHASSLDYARWQSFAGGHPLPNQQSLNAARASFDLLHRADHKGALVLFLISGGGSAMMEWPVDEQITLEDLREANRLLVSCGASIAEINSVRRAISGVKGGRLAARVPNAAQLTLIISDTNTGDEASVASGPTIAAPANTPDAQQVVLSYETLARLPSSIVQVINKPEPVVPPTESQPQSHYVLLDNHIALEAAAEVARRHGFLTEIASDIVESEIEEGCSLLLTRLTALRSQDAGAHEAVCLISGGEFRCPVLGNGTGGRNAETVLRCAIELDQQNGPLHETRQVVVLSAGTDGIDGNSLAAGATADNNTVRRARALDLDANTFLKASDAFTLFDQLDDAIVTGATGTNVRDLRILLAR